MAACSLCHLCSLSRLCLSALFTVSYFVAGALSQGCLSTANKSEIPKAYSDKSLTNCVLCGCSDFHSPQKSVRPRPLFSFLISSWCCLIAASVDSMGIIWGLPGLLFPEQQWHWAASITSDVNTRISSSVSVHLSKPLSISLLTTLFLIDSYEFCVTNIFFQLVAYLFIFFMLAFNEETFLYLKTCLFT